MNVSSYIIANGNYNSNIITDSIISVGNKEINEKLITNTNESECNNGCNVCSSKPVVKLMSKFINETGNDEKIVKKIEEKLKCDTESCVLINKDFNNFIKQEVGNNNIIQYELNKNFKAKGPRNTTDLLSNYNIDETLIRWAREFTQFYPCPFSMIDFKVIKNEFCNINLTDIMSGKGSYNDPIEGVKRRVFKTFACVLNTDVSTGRGKHWVCVFVDCRGNNWSIEYFNSSGNPPHYDVNEWMETQRANLLKIHNKVVTVTVTNIVHQRSNTECGMYVLYYIRSRLDGVPYTHFLSKRIDDKEVTKFRKHVFRKY